MAVYEAPIGGGTRRRICEVCGPTKLLLAGRSVSVVGCLNNLCGNGAPVGPTGMFGSFRWNPTRLSVSGAADRIFSLRNGRRAWSEGGPRLAGADAVRQKIEGNVRPMSFDSVEAGANRAPDEPASPLWLVTREPLLNGLVVYLDDMRRRMAAAPDAVHTFEFSRSELDDIRKAFARMIRQGEEKLHRVCELLCGTFFDSQYTLQSVVIGEVDSSHERFTLAQTIAPADLYSQTDLDLGNRQLQRLRYLDGAEWSRASLVANFVEYQPALSTAWGIHKCISRIKAEEQIWNKVVDAIFGLDRLVRLDKQLRHLGHFVKDVFGVKIVVGDAHAARTLHDALLNVQWQSGMLERHSVPVGAATSHLEFIEVKDYMALDGRKATGWEAIKSVFKWWDIMIEVQVQPLWNYHQEREFLTRQSHAGFKAHREALRNQIADTIPLFSFYRNLLRWLFLSPDEPAPAFSSVHIVVRD